MSKDKEKRYQIEVTETQLRVINEALDEYARICCGQLDEHSLWNRFEDVVKEHSEFYNNLDVWDFRDAVKDVQYRFIGGRGADYNATAFVGNCYTMYKDFKHHLYKESGRTDWCVDSSPNVLKSGDQPKPKIKTLKD